MKLRFTARRISFEAKDRKCQEIDNCCFLILILVDSEEEFRRKVVIHVNIKQKCTFSITIPD